MEMHFVGYLYTMDLSNERQTERITVL